MREKQVKLLMRTMKRTSSLLQEAEIKLVLLLLMMLLMLLLLFVDGYYFREVGLLLCPFGEGNLPIITGRPPSERKIYAFGYENGPTPSASLGKPRAPSELKTSASFGEENLRLRLSKSFYCSLRLFSLYGSLHPVCECFSYCGCSRQPAGFHTFTLYYYVRVPYLIVCAFGLAKILIVF